MSREDIERRLDERKISDGLFEELATAARGSGNYREKVIAILEGHIGQPHYESAVRTAKTMLMLREHYAPGNGQQ